MTKQEKLTKLTKYLESLTRILSGQGLTAAKRSFFERDVNRTKIAIERLR